jgi:hypothetical protein
MIVLKQRGARLRMKARIGSFEEGMKAFGEGRTEKTVLSASSIGILLYRRSRDSKECSKQALISAS